MRASEDRPDRLFRHDSRILITTVRANFVTWQDRLIACAMLLAALMALHRWFADRPWETAAWVALGAGLIAGLGAERLIVARIRFHHFDGLLAADALHPPTRRRYAIAWHGLGVATLASITLVAQPSLLIVSVPAYLAGILAVRTTAVIAIDRIAPGRPAAGRQIRSALRQPGARVVAAVILLLSLLPAHALGTKGLLAILGIEAFLLGLMLTVVDHAIVRFLAIAGHRPWDILVRHADRLLVFACVTIPTCWLAAGPVPAGIVSAISVALLLLLAIRVFAYCVHDKRFADLLVSIFAGLLILVAYLMVVLLPFAAIAILWRLQRRATARMWLLA